MLYKIRYRITVLKALRPFAYGVNIFLFLNFLIGLVVMGLGFVQPLFYKLFINKVILAQRFSLMPTVVVGYFSVFILKLLSTYSQNYCTNRWVNHVTFRAKIKY